MYIIFIFIETQVLNALSAAKSPKVGLQLQVHCSLVEIGHGRSRQIVLCCKHNSFKNNMFLMRLCFLGLFWSHSCTILGGFLFCCVFVVLVGSFLWVFLVVWLRFYLFLLVNLFLLPCQCATGNGFPIEINAFDFCFSCYPAFLPSHHTGFCTDTEKIPRLGHP